MLRNDLWRATFEYDNCEAAEFVACPAIHALIGAENPTFDSAFSVLVVGHGESEALLETDDEAAFLEFVRCVVPVIARAINEVRVDVASGLVPVTVSSFAELHDHVDANGYGGAFEDEFDIPLLSFI